MARPATAGQEDSAAPPDPETSEPVGRLAETAVELAEPAVEPAEPAVEPAEPAVDRAGPAVEPAGVDDFPDDGAGDTDAAETSGSDDPTKSAGGRTSRSRRRQRARARAKAAAAAGEPRPSVAPAAAPQIEVVEVEAEDAETGGKAACTLAQMRRFIKSRSYVPLHELRRRFEIEGSEDEVSPISTDRGTLFVGLPAKEARFLGDLIRSGEVGCEMLLDPCSPGVVGVFAMRPVARQ